MFRYLSQFKAQRMAPRGDAEGTLAQSAERILAGELPHRDFVERYTGGLSYLNAFAFRVFGVQLLAMRYALFVAFIAGTAVS